MTDFDFITSKEFRESLESDYRELGKTFEAGAWKSVQVLAGSIVEALLIDYILATSNPSREKKDPLKLDLAEAVKICHSEGVISQRTSELCSVIRSYRNLIHAGRTLRLQEAAPSEGSAKIAVAVIDLIVADIVDARRKKFGFTAKQLLDKVERDPHCLPILGHLLADVQQSERDKLVLDVIPQRYQELAVLAEDDYEPFEAQGTLRKTYWLARNVASEDAHKSAAIQYVRVLKEGDSNLVKQYDEAFFRAADLKFVPESQRDLVKQHLLSSIGLLNNDKLVRLRGIESYLTPKDVTEWLTILVRIVISKKASESFKEDVRNYFAYAVMSTSAEVDENIRSLLDSWISIMKREARDEEAAEVEKMLADIALPF